jgi:hypothetical protein
VLWLLVEVLKAMNLSLSPEQSDSDTFVMFIMQSICRDNPSALHNPIACVGAGSAYARFFAQSHVKMPEALPQQSTVLSVNWFKLIECV